MGASWICLNCSSKLNKLKHETDAPSTLSFFIFASFLLDQLMICNICTTNCNIEISFFWFHFFEQREGKSNFFDVLKNFLMNMDAADKSKDPKLIRNGTFDWKQVKTRLKEKVRECVDEEH